MTSRAKKIFLASTVIVPFLIYAIIYYAPIIRNAPFKAKEFVSLEYKWGDAGLENTYNSATGEYRYLNDKDSLIVKNLKLTQADQKFLDENADVQGFWNLPDVVANGEADLENKKALRYFIKFNYEKKSKQVTYFPSFNGNVRMKSAIAKMQKVIEQRITDIEARKNN